MNYTSEVIGKFYCPQLYFILRLIRHKQVLHDIFLPVICSYVKVKLKMLHFCDNLSLITEDFDKYFKIKISDKKILSFDDSIHVVIINEYAR